MRGLERNVKRLSIFIALVAITASCLALLAGAQEQTRGALLRGTTYGERAAGVLDVGNITLAFYNDGRLVPEDGKLKSGCYYPSGSSKGERYLYVMDLWVGVPDGPWAPQVFDTLQQSWRSMGPTVSGTLFDPFRRGQDWNPVPYSRGSFYSGEVLYGDLYPASVDFNPMLLATSTLPESWPRHPIYGTRVWPGRWRRDASGRPMAGAFFGDQVVFFAFQDYPSAEQIAPAQPFGSAYYGYMYPQRGYSLGAYVECTAVGFEHAYAKDIAVFDLELINKSAFHYAGVYLGLYFEMMCPEGYTRVGYLLADTTKGQFAGERFDMSYGFDPVSRTPDLQHVAVAFVKTPPGPNGQELGLTGWHVFDMGAVISIGQRELVQYKVLSGDTTGMAKVVKRVLFFPGPDGRSDPRFDPSEYLGTRGIGIPPRTFLGQVPMVMSCGPLDWPRGDTLNLAVAIAFGQDMQQLKSRVHIARKIVQSGYRRAEAPPPPKVVAVPGNRTVTLYWDKEAEQAVDFITGYPDFEGYRIYRTTRDPALGQWGDPIYDADGRLLNFVPIATCDLKNDIKGYEEIYPFQKLGDDTGLFHSWVDTTVQNGVTYWYSVCSYDHGILANNPKGFPRFRSQECPKGTDVQEAPNLVEVTPSAMPPDVEAPKVSIAPLPGTFGNGIIELEVIDPAALTGHSYLLSFEDTSLGLLVYNVTDEASGKRVVQRCPDTKGESVSIFDGISLRVQRSDSVGISRELSGWKKLADGSPSPCTWRISGRMLSTKPFPYEYEIRFLDTLTTGRLTGKTAPFVVWNTVLNRPSVWDIYYDSKSDTTDSLRKSWSSGDFIYIWDDFQGKLAITWGVILSEFGYTRVVRRVIQETYGTRVVYDTVRTSVPPKPGDVARVVTVRPFRTGDTFRITTTGPTPRPLAKADLEAVCVVPNPFVGGASWDRSPEEAKIAFMNLPHRCAIDIYNLVGEKVYTIHHDNVLSDTAFWNLLNFDYMRVAYGLYIYVVRTPDGRSTMGKFAILR
ncbi:MAG: hypothetical protein QHJ34_12215 [bacterium]|nr:hypothetical protein [candidate division KSB1 bacterium]MDH7560975.1 hypothetical protein [bacterium]